MAMDKKRLKIAFLSFYSGELYRGVETLVHDLANRLTALGHDVSVHQNGPKIYGTEYRVFSTNIPVNLNKKSSIIPFIGYWPLRVGIFTKTALSRVDSDTQVLVCTNGQWQSLLCRLWAWKNKKKMVILGQSGPGLDDRFNLLCFPDIFVSMTDFQSGWAKRANPFVKVVKIPNGTDLIKFKHLVKGLNVDLPRPIILSVAALVFYKRLALTIRAMVELNKGSLLLVGKGEEETKLKRLGEKLLPRRFKIMSFPYKDMPPVYRAADLFTYPIVPWESFGIAMLEAMASGLPVVATDDPIRREIVGDAGVFIDPRNTQAYADALKLALKTKWGNKPRKQAEKFSWDRIAKKYEDLLGEITR